VPAKADETDSDPFPELSAGGKAVAADVTEAGTRPGAGTDADADAADPQAPGTGGSAVA
jgi:hypothetical protein